MIPANTCIEEIKPSKKKKTHAAHSKALAYFQESCAKMYLEDIETEGFAEVRGLSAG